MFERVITQTIQTISQQVLRERPLIALSEILEEERIPYRFKPFFETEVYWWLHNESLVRSANKRFDYENPEVASLLSYLEQVQFRHARFEREEFMAVLDSAVKLSYNYLCRPQITLKWYLFRGQPVKPLREVMLRFGAFSDYGYFFHVFSEWVERKIQERPTFDAISATEFERIIRRVDDQILLSCTVEDLLAMMDPLFEFIGEGDDLIIPIDALIIFFDDKNINKLVEHLERIRERGMATVGREEFVGLLDELLTTADENPEADFSNVYQNDELDDVVRMHLQSGPARAGEAETTVPSTTPIVEHQITPNVTPETFAPIPSTIPPHQRTPRAPIDPALLDALDADDDTLPATQKLSEPVRSTPTEPADEFPLRITTAATPEPPVVEEVREQSPQPLEQQPEPEPEPAPEPEPEPEQPEDVIADTPEDAPLSRDEPVLSSDLPTAAWRADRSEEVNEEVEEWVEGLAEALGEWEENPADSVPPLNGNGAVSSANRESASTSQYDDDDSEEIDNIGHLLDDDDDEDDEIEEYLVDDGATERSPVRRDDDRDDESHDFESLVDDELIEASGTAGIAPDDVFEAADDHDPDEQDDPLREPAIFQIDDLEEEFEQEGPADEEEVGDTVTGSLPSADDFPENPIAGRLSGHEGLLQPERPQVEQEDVDLPGQRNGLAVSSVESQSVDSGAQSLQDVRRFIDAMLERKLVKKIFQRDRAAYDVALNQLNGAGTWRAASQILDEIFIRYEIDPYSRTALRFTDSVYARYLPGKQ